MSAYRTGSTLPPVLVVAFNTHVVGVEPQTGVRLWSWSPMPAGAAAGWRIAFAPGGRVLACGGTLVVCLAYETGKELWRRDSPVSAGTLLVEGDRFFLAGSGTLAAFDLDSGKLLWHEPFKGHGHGAVALGFPGNVVQADDNT